MRLIERCTHLLLSEMARPNFLSHLSQQAHFNIDYSLTKLFMRGGFLLRALLLLLISHAVILFCIYEFPDLARQLKASLPFNTSSFFSVAMTAVAGARPAFLTRTLLLSNPNHRAGKPCRRDTALAYPVFAVLKKNGASIRRSLDPYQISSKSMHTSSTRAASTASSAIPHISLHIAASSSGKGHKFKAELSTYNWEPSNTSALGLQKGSTLHEKRRSRPESGQDAYFVARVGKDSNTTAFAIADGVGGWTDHGVDPADFSHGICSHMANISLNWDPNTPLSPLQLLDQGYKLTITDPDIVAGGSTACVAVTTPDGRMKIANLGDSGFLQLRLGTVHHYSNPQTHAFNTPYQMSLTPPDILRQARIFGSMPLNDQPDRADLADHMLRHGDVLVLATDGVWDNLDSQDVLKIVARIMRESGAWTLVPTKGYAVSETISTLTSREAAQKLGLKMQGSLQSTLAAAIVGEAKSAGLNKHRDGPFAKAVMKEYPYDPYHGGKPDDIAVLVVVPVDHGMVGQGGGVKAKL
jgi:protein phosphatase PTC7